MDGERVIVISRFPLATRRVCALFALVLASGVSSCSTSEPQPLSLALADAGQTGEELSLALPDSSAIIPSARPDMETPATNTTAPKTATLALQQDMPADEEPAKTIAAEIAGGAKQPVQQAALTAAATGQGEPAANAEDGTSEGDADPETALALAEKTAPQKPKTVLFASLFSAKPKPSAAADADSAAGADGETTRLALVDPRESEPAPKKVLKTITSEARASSSALPGVRSNPEELFEIKHRTSINDDTNVDIEEDDGSYQVASAAGLARLAPNGLRTQHSGVDVQCLKPGLVRMLKTIEHKYGRPVVITSGYRSPSYNRRVRGAKKSLHMYCAAADIQIAGVSKWSLASFLRTMPERGGVGTYCHTNSVHVDIGPARDWNWRCRRRR
jgi:uncharacterized protein YcbK (DUF882 family)